MPEGGCFSFIAGDVGPAFATVGSLQAFRLSLLHAVISALSILSLCKCTLLLVLPCCLSPVFAEAGCFVYVLCLRFGYLQWLLSNPAFSLQKWVLPCFCEDEEP